MKMKKKEKQEHFPNCAWLYTDNEVGAVFQETLAVVSISSI